jgi:hypothetical protein
MTTTNTIADYMNGNCHITLLADGTKTREWDGAANPVYPESIDLKITDWCDVGCAWCHEKSNGTGRHAAVYNIMAIVDGLPRGTEIAIGGGDALSHPCIQDILHGFRSRGLIANITVSAMHAARVHTGLIRYLRQRHLIYGLGMSFDRMWWINGAEEVADDNTVIHFIAGIHRPLEAMAIQPRKLLVLGYKRYGRGESHYGPAVERRLSEWRYWLRSVVNRGIASFDNLAIEQLGIRERFGEDVWQRNYMGDDGQFTMYVDAVNMAYSASSVRERLPVGGRSIAAMFTDVRAR